MHLKWLPKNIVEEEEDAGKMLAGSDQDMEPVEVIEADSEQQVIDIVRTERTAKLACPTRAARPPARM